MLTKKTLISVVGPTAVGKTAMAIALAKHYRTEILSADSRQFYREMSIGTAKPSPDELAEAKHHFINSHSVTGNYSAGDFERDALLLLDHLFESHDVVVMVGGSGLFVRALTEGLDDLPKAPVPIRERLNQTFEQYGIKPLQDRLRSIDPEYYASTDFQNPQRVIRALEVYETTGKPISHYQQKKATKRPFQVFTIGLNTDRTVLYERINTRVELMMKTGLLDEAKTLLPFRTNPALLTVGYAELFDYLDGKTTLQDAVASIKQNSRRYAKRQITWFKKYGDTTWFEPNDVEGVLEFLEKMKIVSMQ